MPTEEISIHLKKKKERKGVMGLSASSSVCQLDPLSTLLHPTGWTSVEGGPADVTFMDHIHQLPCHVKLFYTSMFGQGGAPSGRKEGALGIQKHGCYKQ